MKRTARYKLRLYVAESAQNGALAIANINAICRDYLPGRHELEIVDVIREPRRALDDRIFMTPTLVKLAPSPVRKVVGTLVDEQKVLLALDLEHSGSTSAKSPIDKH